MANINLERGNYYSLLRNNSLQYIVLAITFALTLYIVFNYSLQIMEKQVVEIYLQGKVYNDGKKVAYSEDEKKIQFTTDKYTNWAIDVFLGTSNQTRYWFNPIISALLPLSLFSIFFSLLVSSLLPRQFGLMRQKIEREIVNQLDKLHFSKFGYFSDEKNKEIEIELLNSNDRELDNMAVYYQAKEDDIKGLSKAIKWINNNFLYRILHFWTGFAFYLKSYFTEKHGNTVLALVYIGAAVLIIIIGMRGLKFIPANQPSLVFFALGLEFSVLIAYAMIIMYSRPESEQENEQSKQETTSEIKNSREIENLLRVFIKKTKNN